ncbi:MAG: ABC transporter permease [Candidatus Limnocylindrales bacterium]
MNSSFMRLVLLVAQRDYLRTVRRRGFIIATLLLPAGMAVMMAISGFAAASGTDSGHQPIVVVNESSVELTANPQLTPDVQLVARSDADAQLASGVIKGYYLVPAGWPAPPTVLHIEAPTSRTSLLDIASGGQGQVELLLRVAQLRAAGLPDSALGTLLTPITYQSQTPDGQPITDVEIAAGFLLPYAFALIFVLGIFITSGYLLQSVNEEKENRVVEIVLSSIPALPLMAGKIVGLGGAGLTQIVIWLLTVVVGLPLLNAQLSVNIAVPPVVLALTVVLYAVGYLTYGALFAAIGALATGSREGQQLSSIVVLPAIIPVVLVSFFLRDTNSPIVWLLTLLPLTAPGAILEVVAIAPSPPWLMIGLSLLSQLIVAAIAIVLSGRIFRATVLLYGVRPSLGRIVAALTGRA